MVDSSNHITGKTGLTLTITESKDGGAFASISPTVTERGSGWYSLALTTSHTDTLGDLALHITGTGADATDISRQVVVQIPGEVITSNVTQINGLSTSSNLATLKLKSLDLRSNDTSVAALEVYGATGGAGLNGGKAINIQGGGAGTGGATGGAGLYVSGGGGTSTRGYAMHLDSPITGQTALRISGNMQSAVSVEQNITVTKDGDIGSIVANILGSVSSISTVRPKKNTGLDNFMFPMFDATTKNPKTGLTVTAERAIDGNPFSPCSSGAVELSNGVYRVSLSADDLNGNKIMLRFSASGADDQLIEIITQD